MTAAAVKQSPSQLEQLAETVNREHQLVMQAAHGLLTHAIAAGRALLAIQPQIADGFWKSWVEENVDVAYSTANDYMRAAHFSDYLEEHGVSQLKDALTLLRGRTRNAVGKQGYGPDMAAKARELARQGVSSAEIELRLGVSKTTVYWWLNPDEHRAHLRKLKARNAEAKRLREQTEARTIQRSIRKRGGAVAELYAMAERMQDVMGQAHGEEENTDARRHLALAGQHYRRMRDEIVKALGAHA